MPSKSLSPLWLLLSTCLFVINSSTAFTASTTTTTTTKRSNALFFITRQTLSPRPLVLVSGRVQQTKLFSNPTTTTTTTTTTTNNNNNSNNNNQQELAQKFDALLDEGNVRAAQELLQSHSDQTIVSLDNKERWNRVFSTIEQQTAQAEETTEVNMRKIAEFPTTSQPRNAMTRMYQTLKDQNQLRVFGAIDAKVPPAAGSHAVRPSLLEEITGLPMKALTPQPSNNLLLFAGVSVAVLEGLASVFLGINLNLLVLITLLGVGFDRIVLNGAIAESIYKLFNPAVQTKIQRHEAGHFLAAYLMGCPVEGCVLNAWEALADSRFGAGRQVTAGTSFFDPILSDQINSRNGKVTRSSIDRYAIIVMAGIAAEAVHYGQADGGAGDEMALIAFLSQLNGPPESQANGSVPPWNNITIRNQARWGALQAVLMLREYKPCYEALVGALEQGGKLGDCIYAIEKAARDNNLGPLRDPLGYIVEKSADSEEWTTQKPANFLTEHGANAAESSSSGNAAPGAPPVEKSMNTEESMAQLNRYRQEVEDRLKKIEEKLGTMSRD